MAEIKENQKKIVCKHIKVKDYLCLECNNYIPEFKNIFDTGNICTYLNIKYVNEFQDQVESNNMGQITGAAKVIYENYKPKNIQEMREYILFTIDKSIKSQIKIGMISKDIIKMLGSIGNPKHISTELK